MPKKVFELAKDLDLKPLELVEKLRDKGFMVRNHMAELTDDELVKVLEFLKPTTKASEEKSSKASVVKKKVVKKATQATEKVEAEAAPLPVEKEETQVKAPEGDEKVEELEDTEALLAKETEASDKTKESAGSLVRKKVTVRKKGVQDTEDHELASSIFAASDAVSGNSEQPSEQSQEKAHRPSGLRVVSRPQKKVEKKQEEFTEEVEDGSKEKLKKKDYLEEKIHRFTPVFIPPKSEETKKPAVAGKKVAEKTDTVGPLEAALNTKARTKEEEEEDEKTSKKRLGGLASIMSGKRPILSRSAALSQIKAETELKSYSLLSNLGRPIYTPVKKKKSYAGPAAQTERTELKESKRVITIHKVVKAEDLAQKLSLKFQEMADRALEINLLLKPTDFIGLKLAGEIGAIWHYRVDDKAFDEAKVLKADAPVQSDKSNLPHRPPVVTIMGHVDHGKTTLLDYIRNTKIASGEAGGITQHIGAYSVKVKDKSITFLDTPGHAAFANMRQRGAKLTDIVILVVAADDGVMPQTRESIKFCQNAGVPIIVAVNKMDKEGASPDKIKTSLTEYSITAEDWGGETQFVPISALKGMGIDALLEGILLQAEIMDLRASTKGMAKGVVIESKIEVGRGPVATVLIQEGTLSKGDSIVVGETSGRARSLMDHKGEQIKDAGPSCPVQILGLEEVPNPGDTVYAVKTEREAKKIVDSRINSRKELEAVPERKKLTLEDFFNEAKEEGDTKILNLVIRTDVQGSYEAIKNSLEALSNNEVAVKVIGGGVGAISDTDIMMSVSSKAIVIGFNMRPVSTARRMAEEKGVDVKTYSIIYDLINDVKLALEGLLEPEFIEEFSGRAEVRDVFSIPKIGTIAGSYVTDGKIQTGCKIRLLRSGKIVFDGKLSSLKRFKDDAKEVKTGLECGVGLENYNDVKVGDIFEAYMMIEKKRKLEDVAGSSANNAKTARSGAELGQM